jgi:hypothetical protein
MSEPKASADRLPTIRLGRQRAMLLALVVAGLFGAYLSEELRQNHEPGFPLDDSWIHLTFARNLARGWGFAYNRGEPVAGSTAPLWTFTLAFFHVFTRNAAVMVVIAKLLGAALLFVSAAFAFRIAVWITAGEWPALAAGLAVATLGPMGWAMMSGMEVTLSVALTLAGIYYYLRFRTGRMSTLAWVLFGLAAWARPESLLLAAFAALDSLLRRFVMKQRLAFWRGFGIWLAIVVSNRRIFDLSGLVTREFLGYRQDREGFMAFFRNWKPDFLVIFPAAYPGLRDAPFLKAVASANVQDNTSAVRDFQPRPRAIAGLLFLDLAIQPMPATMTVYKCNW